MNSLSDPEDNLYQLVIIKFTHLQKQLLTEFLLNSVLSI